MSRPIRILLAKPQQDCHDRGVRYLARQLRDAGFEVIFMNFLLAEEVVQAALTEDVQAIGISSSSGGHMPAFEDLLAALSREGMDDVIVIGGGVISPADTRTLNEWGVGAVFGPGSTAEQAVDYLNDAIRQRQGSPA